MQNGITATVRVPLGRVWRRTVPPEQPLDLPDAGVGLLDLLPETLVWDVHILAACAGLNAVRAVAHGLAL